MEHRNIHKCWLLFLIVIFIQGCIDDGVIESTSDGGELSAGEANLNVGGE